MTDAYIQQHGHNDWQPAPEDLLPIEDRENKAEQLSLHVTRYSQDVWNYFKKNNLAMVGIFIILFMILFATVTPLISSYGYNDQHAENANIPPLLTLYMDDNGHEFYKNSDQKVWLIGEGESYIQAMELIEKDTIAKQMRFALGDIEVILDYNNKQLTLLQADGSAFTEVKRVWNKAHILGTDDLGRDLLIRVAYGARISLLIALVATCVNLLIGVLYGSIAGFFGGKIDNIMMRIVDIIDTIPLVLYVILIMVTIGSGIKSVIIAIGSVYWLGTARIVRGEVLRLKAAEYVMVARTIGTSASRILFWHIIPNAIAPIIVTVVLMIPKVIFMEAFLSYIGLGVAAPLASWGTLCNDATAVIMRYPYQLVMPTIAICLTMFAFNFVGEGLRDATDPQIRR